MGIFSKSETALFPQFGNPMFVREKNYGLFCILGPLGTFLVLTKIFTFWVVLWFVEVGMGDPPLWREKIPTFHVFSP